MTNRQLLELKKRYIAEGYKMGLTEARNIRTGNRHDIYASNIESIFEQFAKSKKMLAKVLDSFSEEELQEILFQMSYIRDRARSIAMSK